MSAAGRVSVMATIISVPALCSVSVAEAQGPFRLASTDALKSLSVEELMNIEVTSVSRRPEKLLEAPAAIQVLSGEDIRRSGVTNLPSALRLANNLDVAQENAHEWVISARGFSSDVGNKLLVLMDGRTL
jgi:iron complex outermembrane recepter protein